MSPFNMSALPSLRRQQLLSEFAGLKQACPEGIFVSLTPGDATLWSGVLFVRKGPYCPAILRFQISFPDSYPQLPPVVVFTTDMFHPLITPLTTYMYTTDIQESGTVSASDQERLPPGGFSLRHGFPDWFGRGRRSMAEAKQIDQQRLTSSDAVAASTSTTPAVATVSSYTRTGQKSVSAYEVLHYIRSAFDDEAVLDSVPLTAAGNPGAWHAWRTHRKAIGKLVEDEATEEEQKSEENDQQPTESAKPTSTATPRQPGEWNWDGVWEDRVKKNVSSSLSEPVLYGETKTSDDLIKFLEMEDNDIDSVKDNLRRTLGQT
ncbi:ubiquitin-conjugating enzyme/RWD-like protein [Fusarium venenatum]|uniref:ubiquitin-conjugating enzyme/RWD-like protein n=1 Tax=Fusarium venenatum TaxID=56646 RepID=UPI001D993ECF|nr:ubiquitin-conjugating enzyme/RWD-like protein [Fusarium venenatum]